MLTYETDNSAKVACTNGARGRYGGGYPPWPLALHRIRRLESHDRRVSCRQWLKGRIYERRCDISPDGKHLIYFAMNGRWREEAKGSWTAISRALYLTVLTLLAKGDCWHGGGLFVGNDAYWLNDGYGHEVSRRSLRGMGVQWVHLHWPDERGWHAR